VVVPVAVLLVVAMFVPVALRRRYPVGAFVVGVAVIGIEVLAVADGLGEPSRPRPVGSAAAIGILLYTVAANRPRRVSVPALLVCLAGAGIALLVWPGSDNSTGSLAADFAVPPLLAWLLGDSAQWRRSYYRGLEERAVRAERERDAHAQVAAAAERARIARELHDVVAHNVSVMVVQADGAAFALETSPDKTRQALTAISRTGRQALTEMRSLLGVLRSADDEADLTPQPGIEQLTRLLEQARAAGLPVSFTVAGVPRPMRVGAALTAYRIVQESLTNARKHGGPTVTAAVTLGFCEDKLVIKVSDDGRARTGDKFDDGPDGLGHGLIGMRERVEVYGGTVTAGPQPSGGWRVTATLPLAPATDSPPAAGGMTAPVAPPAHTASPPHVVSPGPAGSLASGTSRMPGAPAEPGAA
jgi:signal transduction histidine kinase